MFVDVLWGRKNRTILGSFFRLRYIVGKCRGGMLNFQILFLCIYLISLIIIGQPVDVKFKPK